jgi:UDP-N-acetylmuramoylalanine--D-glutamate ligase
MAGAEKLAASVESLAGCGVRFVLGRHEEADFTGADLIVANQAVRPENRFLELARKNGIPVITETGLALALNPAPWLGITGSAGKSTTTALLHAMLLRHDPAALLGGNIGGDLLTRVERQPASSPVVVELSSYQLTYVGRDLAEGFVRPPRVAVFTNLTPNHLDWHRDMDEYAATKQSLALRQKPEEWTVLNHEDANLRGWAGALPGRALWTSRRDSGMENAAFLEETPGSPGAIVLRTGGEERARFSLERLRLMGDHNRLNAVQATAAACLFVGDEAAVRGGLETFPGLPHRLEIAVEAGGKLFVNDSKATTPEAAMTALRSVDRPCVLIAGGYDKQSPFDALGEEIQRRAAGLVLLGAAAPRIRAAVLAAAGERPPALGALPLFEAGDDFAAAVAAAEKMTPEGGAVLLSPACASWGMFANYEERGERFKTIAQQ